MEPEDFTPYLEVYTLDELIEMSDVTPEEALAILHEVGVLNLPEVKPVV
jgi:hypothetical protein